MVRISVLNDALKNMFNAEKRGKRQVLIKPSSKVIIKFLSVMQKHGKLQNKDWCLCLYQNKDFYCEQRIYEFLLRLLIHLTNYISAFSGYIGEFELVDDHRAGKIVVELNGRLNKCGVISPRYNIGVSELEDWTARLLPSRQVIFGGCKLQLHCFHSLVMSPSSNIAASYGVKILASWVRTVDCHVLYQLKMLEPKIITSGRYWQILKCLISLWYFFVDVWSQFGFIVLTTSAGIIDHDEARRKNVGGKVLGFFYWE